MPRCFALIAIAMSAICAADGGASITSAPGLGLPRPVPGATAGVPGGLAQARSMPQPMMRPLPAYEVESLAFAAGDPAGLAQWAELAAQGFHAISATCEGGKQVLLLERMAPMGGKDLRLPAAVECNPELAAATHAKLQAIAAERQQAMPQSPPMQTQPSMPRQSPAQAPTPPTTVTAPVAPAAPTPLTPTPATGK